MGLNLYTMERIAADRLAELRVRGARLVLLGAARPARPPLSRWLGAALIRLGHRLAQGSAVRVGNAGVRVAR